MKELKMVIFISVSALVVVLDTSEAMTFDQCQTLSTTLNNSAPMVVDKGTTLTSTFCLDKKPLPELNYIYQLTPQLLNENNWTLERQQQYIKEFWCSDSDQVFLLNNVAVKFDYRESSGSSIGKIALIKSDCT